MVINNFSTIIQDRKDDTKHKVLSTAVLFGSKSKLWLTSFVAVSLSSFMTCGVCTGQTWPYYLAVTAAGAHMFNQVS